MKSLIIGAGEVGKALKEIFSKYHETYIRDIKDFPCEGVEILHICYPDSKNFIEITKNYINQYKPKLTIIHSSVEIGTTWKCGGNIVYSPVRGRHPKNGLHKEIPIFTKFVASENKTYLRKAIKYFKDCKLKVINVDKTETLEFLKLISNIHMGLEIAWRQEVERILKHFDISPKYYGLWEHSYLEGYKKLHQENLIRPIMKPDPIGGHCILPCTEILKEQYPSKFFDLILESNEKAIKGE